MLLNVFVSTRLRSVGNLRGSGCLALLEASYWNLTFLSLALVFIASGLIWVLFFLPKKSQDSDLAFLLDENLTPRSKLQDQEKLADEEVGKHKQQEENVPCKAVEPVEPIMEDNLMAKEAAGEKAKLQLCGQDPDLGNEPPQSVGRSQKCTQAKLKVKFSPREADARDSDAGSGSSPPNTGRRRRGQERSMTDASDRTQCSDSDFGLSESQIEELVQRYAARVRSMTSTSDKSDAADSDFGLSAEQLEALLHKCSVKGRSMTAVSDRTEAADSDFGLSDVQLEELAQRVAVRGRKLTTATDKSDAMDSEFGLSDNQLAALARKHGGQDDQSQPPEMEPTSPRVDV